ncbi:hypothetical protein ONS95_004385 [Cadophora gregata]|uniref:uncharacterized protein n=1 Tax=Cadophora gregata TaxID=51156 RepID=UPI0026DBBEC8|nr:uncharacterized protein ONS95_004385 [Cadophora gregata]KAK0105873.1 hypothetical protein ONS95_004385 [Cadophora gregata]
MGPIHLKLQLPLPKPYTPLPPSYLPVSQRGGLQIQQILSQPPQSGTREGDTIQSHMLQTDTTQVDSARPDATQLSNDVFDAQPCRKRSASESNTSQPEVKKAKFSEFEIQQSSSANLESTSNPQDKPEAHEASVYQNNKIAYGLYIDAGVSPKDVFDNDIIITTLGGGKAKNENGDVQRARDHAIEGRNDTAFHNCLERLQTLLVIVGKKNTNCPVKLHYNFNVLGHDHITAM